MFPKFIYYVFSITTLSKKVLEFSPGTQPEKPGFQAELVFPFCSFPLLQITCVSGKQEKEY